MKLIKYVLEININTIISIMYYCSKDEQYKKWILITSEQYILTNVHPKNGYTYFS
jgi:hypothetical protein